MTDEELRKALNDIRDGILVCCWLQVLFFLGLFLALVVVNQQ